jgi:hypothetical protein
LFVYYWQCQVVRTRPEKRFSESAALSVGGTAAVAECAHLPTEDAQPAEEEKKENN